MSLMTALFSVLIGDEFEWLVELRNFSIHFNHSEPDILNITCTTFVSNPLLQTLLIDEEDPGKNTCPDELKQLISATLLSFNENNNSSTDSDPKSNPSALHDHLNFSPGLTTSQGCQPINEKFIKNDVCIVRTILKTSNCSSPEVVRDDKNELHLTRSSLFNYFKLNYTIEARFAGERGCDVTITSMKSLETMRFYVKNETTDNYACIRERYELVNDDEEAEVQRTSGIVGQNKGTKSEDGIKVESAEGVKLEAETMEKVSSTIFGWKSNQNIINFQKKVQWKSDPAVEWFEMFSLINSIYSANIVYGTLSEWVFS